MNADEDPRIWVVVLQADVINVIGSVTNEEVFLKIGTVPCLLQLIEELAPATTERRQQGNNARACWGRTLP